MIIEKLLFLLCLCNLNIECRFKLKVREIGLDYIELLDVSSVMQERVIKYIVLLYLIIFNQNIIVFLSSLQNSLRLIYIQEVRRIDFRFLNILSN